MVLLRWLRPWSGPFLALAVLLAGASLPAMDAFGSLNNYPGGPRIPYRAPARCGAFWAWCWSVTEARDKNLIPMIWVRHADYKNPARIAAQAHAIPRGKVAIFFWNVAPTLLTSSADTCRTPSGTATHYLSPWLNKGTAAIGRRMAEFFRGYKAAGGHLNYLVLDYETGLGSWSMTKANLRAINADPRSAALKKRLGFSNLLSVGTSRGGLCSERCRRIWNEVMNHIVNVALNRAIYQPARAEFPHLQASNFSGFLMLGLIAPDDNGYYQPADNFFGNAQSPAYYLRIAWGLQGSLAIQETGGDRPFAVLRYELISLQSIERSSAAPMVPWVAYKSYVPHDTYYQDLVYQLALRGTNKFLYWDAHQWIKGKPPLCTAHDDAVMNHCLSVLNRRLGPPPGPALHTGPITWTTGLLVAARKTSAGKILYRVTVPPGTSAIVAEPGDRRINTRGKTGVWVTAPGSTPLHFRAVR